MTIDNFFFVYFSLVSDGYRYCFFFSFLPFFFLFLILVQWSGHNFTMLVGVSHNHKSHSSVFSGCNFSLCFIFTFDNIKRENNIDEEGMQMRFPDHIRKRNRWV